MEDYICYSTAQATEKIIEHICPPYFLRYGVAQLLLQNAASYVLPTAITFVAYALF